MAKRLRGVPYAAGASPYSIKGLGYRGHIQHVQEHVPGGLARALELLDDPATRAFYEQPFLAASWYDIFPLVELGLVCAELMRLPAREYLVQRTRLQAQSDLNTVYHQFLLWIASPGSIAARLPGVMSRYFNFSTSHISEEGKDFIRGVTDNMPTVLYPWYEPVSTTWLLEALRMSGAKAPAIEIETEPMPMRAEDKLEQLSLKWTLRW